MNGGILFASPSRYEGDDAFYVKRDAFRFVQHLEGAGVSAKLVLLPPENGEGVPRDGRLLVAPYGQWTSPEFWKGFGVRTVVVYAFGVLRPRQMPPVFRAIRGAGCRVVFQMDTGFGLVRFPDRCWTMSKRRYWWARGWGRRRSVFHSLARAAAQTAYWAWGGTFRFMCRDLPIVRAGAGTMSRRRTGRSLAEAVRREMDAWGSGARDPDEIFDRLGRASLVSVLARGLYTLTVDSQTGGGF